MVMALEIRLVQLMDAWRKNFKIMTNILGQAPNCFVFVWLCDVQINS